MVILLIGKLIFFVAVNDSYNNIRQVLIFGKEANIEMYHQQMKVFNADEKGIKERDVVVKVVKENNDRYKKYSIDDAVFAIVLIGKDGTEKYRTTELLSTAKLFSLIDAMPMRKREMRQDNN